MQIKKISINGSPYIGVFGSVTEKIGLFPFSLQKKNLKKIEDVLNIEVIKTSIANSDLIGVLVKGNSKGFVVPEIIEKNELNQLKEIGIKCKIVSGVNALGNLIALNDFGGIVSPLLSNKTFNELKKFFGLNLIKTRIAKTEIVGSCLVSTNKGFLAHPNINQKEFKLIKKVFKVSGQSSTANYGNPFIANDVLANSNGALIGEQTSGVELIRIDEGLKGD